MVKELVFLVVALVIIIGVAVPVMTGSLLTETTSTDYCLQDSANSTTEEAGCGLDDGDYITMGWGVTDPEKSFDEDWDTYSSDLCSGRESFLAVYYLPPNSTSGYWNVKYASNASVSSKQFELDGNCFVFDSTGDPYYMLMVEPYMEFESGLCTIAFGCYLDEGEYWFEGDPGEPT